MVGVKFPIGIKLIPDGMFSGCWALQNITIPNTVTTIGKSSFSYCDIKSIVIPASVTIISDYAFRSCNLNYIMVQSGNTIYKSSGNCLIIIGNNTLLIGTNNSVIPNSVKIIADYAFNGCEQLTFITIPYTITEIGNYAFGSCKNLSQVTIPSNSYLTKIGAKAFSFTAITSINISSKVSFIGSGAFSGCEHLIYVYFSITTGWWYNYSSSATNGTNLSSSDLANSATAATLIRKYEIYTWKRS